MKKQYQAYVMFGAVLLAFGLATGPCLAADQVKSKDGLHRDGSDIRNPNRISQAERQAAADRAKAKGKHFKKVGEVGQDQPAKEGKKGQPQVRRAGHE